MSELFDCLENGAGICRNELLFEKLEESCNVLKQKNKILANELENLRNAKCSDEQILKENAALLSRAEKAEAKVAELEDENKSIRHLLSLWKKTEAMKEIERLRTYLKVIENEAPKRNVDWCRRIAREVLGEE